MTSVLEQQLQRIGKAAGLGGDGIPSQKGKASLVYSFREASDIGVEDVYEAGVRGFEQLCRLDPRFQSCRELLFSRQSLSFDRYDHTSDSIVPVRLAIERFCGLLGPYFLLPASTHALEYLVRKFEIHEHNVDAIMRATLPYHGTNEFVRCVQIMSIEGTCFAFLHPMKKSGAVLSREQLVERCKTDQALLRFVCEMARDLADPAIGARNAMGWYAAVVCELINSLSVVGEDFLGFILPYIMHGTRRNVVTEYRDATYMILAQLSSRATLSHHVLTGLVSNIAQTCSPNSMPQVLLLLAYLASSQDEFHSMSNDSFRSLSRLPNLISELSVLTKRVQQSHQFAGMVAVAAVEGILNDGDLCELFVNLISAVELGNLVSIISRKLLDVAMRIPSGQEKMMENLMKALQAFDDQYGKEMESRINEFLQECDTASPERQKVLSVLEKALESSVRAPLLDANVTLGTGVDSASSSVRIMALEKLDAIAQSGSGDIKEDSELILKTALARRLQDEDLHVVNTVLNLKSIFLLPKEILKESLIHCIDNAILLLNSKELSKKQSKVATKNVQQALALFAEQFPSERDVILLSLLLCTKATRKISWHALGMYVSTNIVFSTFFKDIYHQIERQSSHSRTGEEMSSKSENLTLDVREYNNKIIHALAVAILQSKDARSESLHLISVTTSYPSSQSLLYYSMVIAMKSKEKKHNKASQEISSAILTLFSTRDLDTNVQMDVGMEGSGSREIVDQIASRSIHKSHLEPSLLLAALEAAKENGAQQTLQENASALFLKLASLDSSVWFGHLQLLLKKLPNALNVLEDIWSPSGCFEDEKDKVRMVALESWAKLLATEKLSEEQRSLAAGRIPNMLAILAHPDVKMRKCGIEAANTVMESLGKWWPKTVSNRQHMTKELAQEVFKLCHMYSERIIGDSDGIEHVLYSVLCDNTSKPTRRSGQGESFGRLSPILSSEMRAQLSDYFLFELRESGRAHGVANIPLLLALLHDSTKATELQEVGAIVLEHLFLKQTETFPFLGDPLERSAALEIIKLYSDPSIPKPTDSGALARVLNVLLRAASWEGEAVLRTYALLSLSRWGGPGSDIGAVKEVYQVLMSSAVRDTEEACRSAAHKALASMDIKAEIISSLFDLGTAGEPVTCRRKKGPKSQDINLNALASSLPRYLSVLDFLQWRQGISSAESLIQPIERLVDGLLRLSESNQEFENEEVEPSSPAQILYALQLALNALLIISDDIKGEHISKFDISLIVKCASSVSDHAVRTTALDVLRSRIVANPTDALSYVMQAIQVIGDITSSFSDKYSTMLAVQAISAAAAAWIDGGHSMNELVPEVIRAINNSDISKRYTILVSIIESVPSRSSEALASMCYNLLQIDESIHDDWKMEAASIILSKISPETCIAGFSLMLSYCIDNFSQHGEPSIMLRANALIAQTLKKYSGYLRHELRSDLTSSYDLIMQHELKEIQIIGRLRASSSDPKLQLVEDSAYAVVDQMEEIMDAGDFISALVRVISHEASDDSIKRRGFSLLSKAAKSLADTNLESIALQQPIHEVLGIIVSIAQEQSNWTELTRQATLDALSCLVQRLGSLYPDIFLQAIPATVDLVNQQEMPAIQGMGLICLCSFIRSMQESITPMIPRIISATLSGLRFAVAELEEAVASQSITLCAALAALEALATNLAPFLSPVLQDILELLLNKHVVRSTDTECDQLGKSCRRIISSNVPSRLLIGPLSALFGTKNVQEDPRSIQALVQILCGCIMQMDSSSIAVYHVSVFSMLLSALDTRRTRMLSMTASDVEMVEKETVNCIIELTLKLNEGKFKPLFYRLVEWAMSNPEGETQEDTVNIERMISLFHVVIALTENLKSVFTPYFKPLQDPISKSLSLELPQPSEPAPKQRRRKAKVAEKEAESSKEISTRQAISMVKMMSVRALARCFMYDTTGFLDQARFETLLPHLLRQFEQIEDYDKMLPNDDSIAEDKLLESIISSEAKHGLGRYGQTLLACISQMATASGNSETRWRPLHHSILLLTRSSVPHTRLLALESTMAICSALQEEYLPLLPEALPFLSELLEDEDEIIENRTVYVLKQMEELSGEDLKQYLTK